MDYEQNQKVDPEFEILNSLRGWKRKKKYWIKTLNVCYFINICKYISEGKIENDYIARQYKFP